MPKIQTKRIHPKTIGKFWIAYRDMSGNPFIKTVTGKQAKRCGQTLLAVMALIFYAIEGRRGGKS
jgi:hypothetical protein